MNADVNQKIELYFSGFKPLGEGVLNLYLENNLADDDGYCVAELAIPSRVVLSPHVRYDFMLYCEICGFKHLFGSSLSSLVAYNAGDKSDSETWNRALFFLERLARIDELREIDRLFGFEQMEVVKEVFSIVPIDETFKGLYDKISFPR
jgi:hypothetical protein